MAAIRVELISEFKGESVVLVAVDADGLEAVRSALVVAGQQEQPLAVTLGDKKMEFKVEPGAARIELELHTITWRLGPDKIAEIVKKLDFMQEAQRASHHYVEIELWFCQETNTSDRTRPNCWPEAGLGWCGGFHRNRTSQVRGRLEKPFWAAPRHEAANGRQCLTEATRGPDRGTAISRR